MYTNLRMPWDVDPPVPEFPQSSFVRREWNRNGKLESGQDDFYSGSSAVKLDELAKSLGTSSMVTRWRESYPELVGTDGDCVEQTMKLASEAMGSRPGNVRNFAIKVGSATSLLLFMKTK